MEGDPSIYYLWLREHPEELDEAEGCLLSPPQTPYARPAEGFIGDDGDLTLSA